MGRVKYLTSCKLEAGCELESWNGELGSCKLGRELGVASWKLPAGGELEYISELQAGMSNI